MLMCFLFCIISSGSLTAAFCWAFLTTSHSVSSNKKLEVQPTHIDPKCQMKQLLRCPRFFTER